MAVCREVWDGCIEGSITLRTIAEAVNEMARELVSIAERAPILFANY